MRVIWHPMPDEMSDMGITNRKEKSDMQESYTGCRCGPECLARR
jgi:hypothetical protein